MDLIRDVIFPIVVPAATSLVASGVLTLVLKEWISTRIKSSIQHEYDQKLETHKTQLKTEQELAILSIKTALAREAAFHAAAHASFVEGQKAAMERKLSAVDRLWSCVVQFRSDLPAGLHVLDVMTADEYKGTKDHPTFQKLAGDLSKESLVHLTTLTPDIEKVRPFIGEYIWAVFWCYQAILARILVLLQTGRTDAEKLEWYKDTGTRNLIKEVLMPAELAEFDSTTFGKRSWLQRRLESKLLGATHRIISGESFGAESLEQASLIQLRIDELNELSTAAARRR
jgi:hypothetical protein